MDRRSLPLARTFVSGISLMLIGLLAGCGSDRRVYEEAATSAESSVATGLDAAITQTTDLLTERAAVSEISAEDITAVFLTDARNYETGQLDVVKTRALFDLVDNGDGSVTFSVFINASVYRASGLITTSQSRHSCGAITGRFGEGVLSVDDLDCPAVFEQRAGEDSVNLSMTANGEKYGVSGVTLP